MSKYIYYRIFGYVFTIVLHVSNILYMGSVLKGDVLKHPVIKQYNDLQARYFTCWNFGIQVVYAAIGLSCELLTLRNSAKPGYRLPKHLKGARDTLFATLWAATWLVFSAFWTLFLYDRDLVLPAIIDRVLTKTSNHIIHTIIVPIVLWEIIFRPRAVPKSHTSNLMHLALQYLIYFSVFFYTYAERGVWLYPIFERIYGTIYLPLFLIITWVLLVFYYHMQWYITTLVWGDLRKSKNI